MGVFHFLELNLYVVFLFVHVLAYAQPVHVQLLMLLL